MASVVGREFRLELLEELLDEPVEPIIAALEEASAAGLVDEVADDADRFVFPQALVRDTLYERQSGEPPRPAAPPDRAGARAARRRHARPSSPTTSTRAATSTAPGRRWSTPCRRPRSRRRRSPMRTPPRTTGARSSASRGEDAAALRAAAGARRRRGAGGRPARGGDVRRRRRARPRPLPGAVRAGGARRHPGLVAGRRDRPPGDRAARGGARGARRQPVDRAAAGAAGQPAALRGRDASASRSSSARAVELGRAQGDDAALLLALESRHSALLWIEHLDERLRLSEEMLELARAASRELQARALHWRAYDLLEAGDAMPPARPRTASARWPRGSGSPPTRSWPPAGS